MQLPDNSQNSTTSSTVSVQFTAQQNSVLKDFFQDNGSAELKGVLKEISSDTESSKVKLGLIYDLLNNRLSKRGSGSGSASSSSGSSSNKAGALSSPELRAARSREKFEEGQNQLMGAKLEAHNRRLHADNKKQLSMSEMMRKAVISSFDSIKRIVIDSFNDQLKALDNLADNLKDQNKSFESVADALSQAESAAERTRSTYGIDLLPEQYAKAVEEIQKAGQNFTSLQESSQQALLAISRSGVSISREMITEIESMSDEAKSTFAKSVLQARSGDNKFILSERSIEDMFSRSEFRNALDDAVQKSGKSRDEVLNNVMSGMYKVTNQGLANSDLYLKMATSLVGVDFNASRLANDDETKILYGMAQNILTAKNPQMTKEEIDSILSSAEGILGVLNEANYQNEKMISTAALEAGGALSSETVRAIRDMIMNKDAEALKYDDVKASYEEALIPKITGWFSEALFGGRLASVIQSVTGKSMMSNLVGFIGSGIKTGVSAYAPQFLQMISTKFPTIGKLLPAEAEFNRNVTTRLNTIDRGVGAIASKIGAPVPPPVPGGPGGGPAPGGRPGGGPAPGGRPGGGGSPGRFAKLGKFAKGAGAVGTIIGVVSLGSMLLSPSETSASETSSVSASQSKETAESIQKVYGSAKTKKKMAEAASFAVSGVAGTAAMALGAKIGAGIGAAGGPIGMAIGATLGIAAASVTEKLTQSYTQSKDIESMEKSLSELGKEKDRYLEAMKQLDESDPLYEHFKSKVEIITNSMKEVSEELDNKKYEAADKDTKMLMDYKKTYESIQEQNRLAVQETSGLVDEARNKLEEAKKSGKSSPEVINILQEELETAQEAFAEAQGKYDLEEMVKKQMEEQASGWNLFSYTADEFREKALKKAKEDKERKSKPKTQSRPSNVPSDAYWDVSSGKWARRNPAGYTEFFESEHGNNFSKESITLIAENGKMEGVLPYEEPESMRGIMDEALNSDIPKESKNLLAYGLYGSIADNAIAYARDQRGKPYSIYPDGFVCNTLVNSAYRSAGMSDFPALSVSGHWTNSKLHKLPLSSSIPGMIAFSNVSPSTGYPQHMGIMTGSGTWINASGSAVGDNYNRGEFMATPDSKGVVEVSIPTGNKGVIGVGYYDGMFNDAEKAYIPKANFDFPSGPMSDQMISDLSSFIDRTKYTSSVLDSKLVDAWAQAAYKESESSAYGRLALSKNNPFRVREGGALKEYESMSKGVQSYIDDISYQYSYLKGMLVTSQLGILRKMGVISRSDYRTILSNRELKESIDKLTNELRLSNQRSPKQNPRAIAPQNRRYV